jgi:hypothetical protein
VQGIARDAYAFCLSHGEDTRSYKTTLNAST